MRRLIKVAKYEHWDDCPECSECGSRNVKVARTYENADADGRRGIWVRWMECNDCGHEEASY